MNKLKQAKEAVVRFCDMVIEAQMPERPLTREEFYRLRKFNLVNKKRN